MKSFFKITLLTLAFNGIVMVGYGQAAIFAVIFGDKVANENFYLRIDLGASFSSLPGLEEQSNRTAFYYGLGTYIRLNDRWSLSPEFKPLSPRGARGIPAIFDYSVVLSEATYNVNLNYMDVPLMVTYSLPSNLFFSFGPQISFLTSAKQKATGIGYRNTTIDVSEDVRETFNNTIFSAPVEIGYVLSKARGGKTIEIRLRYNIGLSEMISNSAYGSSVGSTFQSFLSFPFIAD